MYMNRLLIHVRLVTRELQRW